MRALFCNNQIKNMQKNKCYFLNYMVNKPAIYNNQKCSISSHTTLYNSIHSNSNNNYIHKLKNINKTQNLFFSTESSIPIVSITKTIARNVSNSNVPNGSVDSRNVPVDFDKLSPIDIEKELFKIKRNMGNYYAKGMNCTL